jgi:hypothetical protein
MVYRNIDSAVLGRINEFIHTLNHESETGSIRVVEGKRILRLSQSWGLLVKLLNITDSKGF